MATDDTGGIYFDDDFRIRIFDVERLEASKGLQENSFKFLDKVGQLQDTVKQYMALIDQQAEKIEAEKLKAIGLRNRAAAMEEESRRKRADMRLSLSEKQEELERLQVEEMSLMKLKQEQELMMAKLSDSGVGGE
ncbi:hypothetical protein BSKO_06385 [Bryopsis sp. KO-2023]|nr:hypothetical protein BSKO_06385 [Bryopsis sp. KO-2023]